MGDDFETRISEEAQQKLIELLCCGNERVELAAAKELVSMFSKQAEDDGEISLEVNITIKEGNTNEKTTT